VGIRHILFPRLTDIWRPIPPVECHWLPVPRRCAKRHERLSCFLSAPQRSRPRCHHRCFSGETSLPGVANLPIRTFHTLASTPSESWEFPPFVPRSASGVSARIVCPGSRVLSLNPHVVFICSDGRLGFSTSPSAFSDFIAPLRSSPIARHLPLPGSFRDVWSSLFAFRLRPRSDSMALLIRSTPSELPSPH
jgi:hypothetical protein